MKIPSLKEKPIEVCNNATVKILKFRTRKFIVITLKVEQDGIYLEYCMQKMQRELQTV